jgi:hypothetical protein
MSRDKFSGNTVQLNRSDQVPSNRQLILMLTVVMGNGHLNRPCDNVLVTRTVPICVSRKSPIENTYTVHCLSLLQGTGNVESDNRTLTFAADVMRTRYRLQYQDGLQ